MTSNLKFLCPSPNLFSKEGLDFANKFFNLHAEKLDQKIFEKKAIEYDGILTRFDKQITKDILRSPRMKYVISPTTGLTHIDLKSANDNDVTIISLQNEFDFLNTVTATAEHTIALIFALKRNILGASKSVEKGNWDTDNFKGTEINNCNIGIIGLGRLGKKVALLCSTLGANIFFYDPFVKPHKTYSKVSSLDEIFEKCNVVSLHVNYNEKNHNLINSEIFANISSLDIFINTARGELVDECAMLKAYKDKRIKKLGIDVLNNENSQHNKTNSVIKTSINNNNMLITPHIAGSTYESIAKTDIYVIEKFNKHRRK